MGKNWAVTQNSVPKAQLKNAASPDSDAIKRAHECLDASKAVCTQMQNFYTQVQAEDILQMEGTGSIPSIMQTAMTKVKEMETEYLQDIANVIYYPDGTCPASVKDVKDMLGVAANALTSLTLYMSEANALVGKFKAAKAKKQGFPSAC